MTTAEMTRLIGREGLLKTDGIRVQVTVLDVKQAYGRTRYVVRPVAGIGVVTVDVSRVTLTESESV